MGTEPAPACPPAAAHVLALAMSTGDTLEDTHPIAYQHCTLPSYNHLLVTVYTLEEQGRGRGGGGAREEEGQGGGGAGRRRGREEQEGEVQEE